MEDGEPLDEFGSKSNGFNNVGQIKLNIKLSFNCKVG